MKDNPKNRPGVRVLSAGSDRDRLARTPQLQRYAYVEEVLKSMSVKV